MFINAQVARNTNPAGDDFWYGPAGGRSVAGVDVSTLSAMQLSISYACDRVLSDTIGQLPLFVYERFIEGMGRDRNNNVDISPLLHDQVNENMTSTEWRRLMQHWVNFNGNAYSRIHYAPNGRIDSLEPLHPGRVQVQLMVDGSVRYEYKNLFTNQPEIILSSDMFHLKGYSDDGYVGLNPVQLQRNAIGANIAGRDYDSRFFKNDAQSPAVVSMPTKFKTPDDRKNWYLGWKERHSGSKQHNIEVLEGGMTYSQTGMKYIDSQFLEMMTYRDIDIARIFGVQPHKVSILNFATFSNIEEQNIDFVQNTILPVAVNWEQSIQRDMIINPRIFAEFSVEGLLRGNVQAQAESGTKAIFGGWRNRNEQRQLENRNPVTELEEFLEPVNTRDAGTDNNSNNGGGSKSMSTREMRLAKNASSRIVHKELVAIKKAYGKYVDSSDGADYKAMEGWVDDFYSGHGEFVSDAMVTDPVNGERYALGGKNAIIGAISAEASGHSNMVHGLLADWEVRRGNELANTGAYNNG